MNSPSNSWKVTLSAPETHPVLVIGGFIRSTDGKSTRIPEGVWVHSGWGTPAPGDSETSVTRPLPQEFEVLWYSLDEDRFYVGEFELPHSDLEVKFREGSFEEMVIGLGPRGCVTLWLAGVNQQVEFATFQAEVESNVPWDRFSDLDRAEYVARHRKRLMPERTAIYKGPDASL